MYEQKRRAVLQKMTRSLNSLLKQRGNRQGQENLQ